MNALSTNDILLIWDRGQDLGSIDRALAILSVAAPTLTYAELLALPIGERDRRLLQLRKQTYGAVAHGFADCPACNEGMEFDLPLEELLGQEAATEDAAGIPFRHNNLSMKLRRISSGDLAAMLSSTAQHEARRTALRSCIIEFDPVQASNSYDELPDELFISLERRLAAADPFAELLFDMACPVCGHIWAAVFDIASFFWTELAAHATRLLQEVHQLARAYGWREAEIIALSARRRSFYLDLVR